MAGISATVLMAAADEDEEVTDISQYHSIGEFYDMFKKGAPSLITIVLVRLTAPQDSRRNTRRTTRS